MLEASILHHCNMWLKIANVEDITALALCKLQPLFTSERSCLIFSGASRFFHRNRMLSKLVMDGVAFKTTDNVRNVSHT